MVRILIIDDHEVVREGVKQIVRERGGEATFGEASTAAEALALVREQDWDIVVLDLSLDGRGGLELLKEMKDLRPRLPVLVLSMHAEEQYARRAFKAGAEGYVTKDRPRADLADAIGTVVSGGRYVTRALAERLVGNYRNNTDRPPHEALSDREFEVLRLIASGKTVGEIAETLCLSDRTISTYRSRLLEKMGLTTNAALTHYAVTNKLVD